MPEIVTACINNGGINDQPAGSDGMKRIIALALVICAFTGLARPAVGFIFSGNDLYQWCGQSALAEQELCTGYIVGQLRRRHCVPEKVPIKKVVDVVKKFLVEHPEKRRGSASVIVAVAVGDAWPCP